MSNKFKVKKKLVSIALALALGAQPLASLPMNVFAGTGKNGVMKAPTIEIKTVTETVTVPTTETVTDFELDNIIELKAGETFNVNNYVKNIQPQGATVNYQFESLLAFEAGAVLEEDGKVTNPWIAKVKVTVGGVSKETYIIANIEGMLNAAEAEAAAADSAVRGGDGKAAEAAGDAAGAAGKAAEAFGDAAETAGDAAEAAEAVAANAFGQAQTAWNVAKNACESAKTALENGLDLESKLKTAYMAYRVAEAVWTQLNDNSGNKQANLNACQKIANALKEVIDSVYSDKVGELEE